MVMGGGTGKRGGPFPIFSKGPRYKGPHYFTEFLLFRFKLHHLQNFAECLILSIRQA